MTRHVTTRAQSILAPNKIRILAYHSVGSYPDDPYSVTPELLASHASILQAHGIPVLSLRSTLTASRPRSGGVVFTFDDGYRDFLINALPVLREMAVPATVFVPTAKVGLTSEWSWRDTGRPVMTWDECRMCQVAGVELEAHTATHMDLSEAPENDISEELERARDDLLRHTGELPISIAYPYGRSNDLVHTVATRYYQAGLSLGGLWGLSSATDRYQIPRYLIRGDMAANEILAIARGRWDLRRAIKDTLGFAQRRQQDVR